MAVPDPRSDRLPAVGRFAGKVALVTAAASGIGEATARAFGREGARVVLGDINAPGGEAVAGDLRSQGIDAHFAMADARVEEDVAQLVQTAVKEYGALDVAANVVGDAHRGSSGPDFHTHSLESWKATFDVAITTTFLCLKHELAYMIENGGGAIVNVSSLAGMLYVPSAGPAYSSAKAGIIQLTRFAAVNYAPMGVRVNCVAPGVTLTPVYESAPPGLVEEFTAIQPIHRPVLPEEQAEAILWLCSDAAAMVTGQNLPVDGGWTAL